MQEKNLFKIALLCSLAGILIILLISENLEIPSLSISEINEDLLDKQVKINGTITRINTYPTLTILNIKDSTGEIKAITFENIEVEENALVEVTGIIKEYRSLLELEIKQLKLI